MGLGALGPGHEWSIPKMFPQIVKGLRRARYSPAEILYFSKTDPPALVAYDVIEQSPESGSLTIRRHLVAQEFGKLQPSPPPSPGGETPTGSSPTPTPSPTPSLSP